MSAAGWLVEWPVRLAPLADLLCCPGAGGGASVFRGWAERLPGYVSVLAAQLPGREKRIDDPPATDLSAAAEVVAAAYLQLRPAPRPLVLFGHSMGGALCHEIAGVLSRRGRGAAALVLAASSPPRGAAADRLDEQALRDLLVRYDPANSRLTGEGELFEALAPTIAADIAMLRSHTVSGSRPEPSWLLSGAADPIVPAEAVARWTKHLTGPIERTEMKGGHFFPFREAGDEVVRLLARVLRQAMSE